jgi:hypothetical protein
MRWANSVAAVAAVSALGACGNYSTEDLRFLAALPAKADLHVVVPADGPPPGSALVSRAAVSNACPDLGDASVWTEARRTSDNLNAGVDWIVGLIDVVRTYPPTTREPDGRTWGPFTPDDHPRIEMRITITRSYPAELAGKPRHAYAFEARWKAPAGPYLPLIEGTFDGASSSQGKGSVALRFDNIRALQMHDATSPDATVAIVYDRTTDPATVTVDLQTGGFGVVDFAYAYAGYADGSGRFDYKFVDALSRALTAKASWDAAKAGRLQVALAQTVNDPPIGWFNQCWDASACLVYVDDPNDFTATCGATPCLAGDVGACATVPSPPF